MKKGLKTALSVGLILLVIGMALVAVYLLRGGSLQDAWNGASVNLNLISTGFGDLKGYTVCSTGEESFSPDEVKRVDLEWISGTVTLEPGGDRLTVTERCGEPLTEDQKLCWKLENGTLSLRFCTALHTAAKDKDLTLRFPADWTAERVTVAGTSAELRLRGLSVTGDLTVAATSGDVLLENCISGDLDAGSTSGSVDLRGCVCRELTLGATSGALRAESCVCDKLDAGTTSGGIEVLRAEAKEIKLGSTSGSLRCEGVPAGCGVSLGTTSGEVRLSLLDTQNDQRIEIGTTSGDVYLDVPGAMDLDYDTASGDMSGHLESGGSGCPTVKVETTSGDLLLGAFD